MNFIETYVDLLMSHPLTTPIVSVGLLALTLHLVLPLLCEIWRYYPNKITGKDTVKNWYLERILGYVVWYYDPTEGFNTSTDYFYSKARYKQFFESNPKLQRLTCEDKPLFAYTLRLLGLYTIIATLASLLAEYLLANFLIYTLVAGLAVGLHFTVVLLGKKVYSISEDVKTLKESCTKENTSEESKEGDNNV